MSAIAEFMNCCGIRILHGISKTVRRIDGKNHLVYPDYSKFDQKKGLMLAVLNDDQIRAGAEQALFDAGYQILIDGFYNINMASPPFNQPSWCTLYAKIEAPDKMLSRFDEGSHEWKKKLPKTREFFFCHTIPKT